MKTYDDEDLYGDILQTLRNGMDYGVFARLTFTQEGAAAVGRTPAQLEAMQGKAMKALGIIEHPGRPGWYCHPRELNLQPNPEQKE
jgi:hypothetical protein